MALYQTLKVTRTAQVALRTATRRLQALSDTRITQSQVLAAALAVAEQDPVRLLAAVLDNDHPTSDPTGGTP